MAISVYVCTWTYGVRRRRMRFRPKTTTSTEYASVYQNAGPCADLMVMPAQDRASRPENHVPRS